jgi:hypothetical protein
MQLLLNETLDEDEFSASRFGRLIPGKQLSGTRYIGGCVVNQRRCGRCKEEDYSWPLPEIES